MTNTELATRISELWDAEYCAWTVRFDEGHGSNPPWWAVVLTWTSESGNAHSADWVEHTWEFYAETIEEALGDAVAFCEALLPFKRCGYCDGAGAYGVVEDRKICADCKGTGLASQGNAA